MAAPAASLIGVGGGERAVNDGPGRTDVRLVLLGTAVRLVASGPAQAAALERAWTRCLDDGRSDTADLAVVASEHDTGGHSALTQLTDEIAGTVTEEVATFRASAVADAHGDVLGLFGVGRSTATTILASGGYGYVTDQLLAVGERGDVLPMPGPLASGAAAVDGTQAPLRGPDDLGLGRADGPLSLAHVVLLDRRADGRPASLERIEPIEAVLGLAGSLTHPWRSPRPLRRVCEVLERTGGAHQLVYEDPADAVALLDEMAKRPQAADGGAEVRSAEPSRTMGQPRTEQDRILWALMDGRVRRAPYLDAVAIDGEAVVLVSTPVRLSPIGVTIWEAAAAAPTIDQLVETVVAVHGAHPQAEALVQESVTSMVAAEVLGYARPIPVERLITGVTARS